MPDDPDAMPQHDATRPAIEYLKLLLGGRNYDVLGRALGVGGKATGHLLNRRRGLALHHLTALCRAWDIPASVMFDDLARVAKNLEMGRTPGDGIRLRTPPPLENAGARAPVQ